MAELQNGPWTTMKSRSDMTWNNLIVPNETAFATLFEMQKRNQEAMMAKGLYEGFTYESENIPCDNIKIMSYHVMQLMSEIGELLESDKRWKNFRRDKFENDEKLKELADCYIVLMNITMFSGFSATDIVKAIADKIEEVNKRIGE